MQLRGWSDSRFGPSVHCNAFGSNRDATLRRGHKALGLIAIPQAWLFQFVLSIVAPLVDVDIIWRLCISGLQFLQHQGQFDADALSKMFVY
jgi:peptidoglycan-N-acetylglucosamine deacetylase